MDPQEVILRITADGRLDYVPEAFREIMYALIASAVTQGKTKPNGQPFNEGERINQIIGTVQAYILGWVNPAQREEAKALYNEFLKVAAEDIDRRRADMEAEAISKLQEQQPGKKLRPIQFIHLRPQDIKTKS